VNGQIVDINAVDGQLYVKVFNHENITFPNFISGNNMSGVPIEIQNIIVDYSISKIEKAFPQVTNDNSIQKIYKFSFDEIEKVTLLASALQKLSYVEYAEKVPLLKIHCTSEYSNWNSSLINQFDHLNLINSHFINTNRYVYTQPGVYVYKYSINGIESQTGKLILE
jgi:hypothetical protein